MSELIADFATIYHFLPPKPAALKKAEKAGLTTQVMIDCSHVNSSKQFKKQITVVEDICHQLAAGETGIIGVMVESHLVEGNQGAEPGSSGLWPKRSRRLHRLGRYQNIADAACAAGAHTPAKIKNRAGFLYQEQSQRGFVAAPAAGSSVISLYPD